MAIAWILGGVLALLALSRPRATVTSAALARLGVVTDTRYLTLEPSVAVMAVEITDVQVVEAPVPGTYAKVWISLKANVAGTILGHFCRIYDDDTGDLVGKKKDWPFVSAGSTWVVKYDWLDDWNMKMPSRVWNLRIEVGTN